MPREHIALHEQIKLGVGVVQWLFGDVNLCSPARGCTSAGSGFDGAKMPKVRAEPTGWMGQWGIWGIGARRRREGETLSWPRHPQTPDQDTIPPAAQTTICSPLLYTVNQPKAPTV